MSLSQENIFRNLVSFFYFSQGGFYFFFYNFWRICHGKKWVSVERKSTDVRSKKKKRAVLKKMTECQELEHTKKLFCVAAATVCKKRRSGGVFLERRWYLGDRGGVGRGERRKNSFSSSPCIFRQVIARNMYVRKKEHYCVPVLCYVNARRILIKSDFCFTQKKHIRHFFVFSFRKKNQTQFFKKMFLKPIYVNPFPTCSPPHSFQ